MKLPEGCKSVVSSVDRSPLAKMARTCESNLGSTSDPGCVETLRGIPAPGILGSVVMRRAKKCKNLSSARHYDQIRFRFRTAKTLNGVHPYQSPDLRKHRFRVHDLRSQSVLFRRR